MAATTPTHQDHPAPLLLFGSNNTVSTNARFYNLNANAQVTDLDIIGTINSSTISLTTSLPSPAVSGPLGTNLLFATSGVNSTTDIGLYRTSVTIDITGNSSGLTTGQPVDVLYLRSHVNIDLDLEPSTFSRIILDSTSPGQADVTSLAFNNLASHPGFSYASTGPGTDRQITIDTTNPGFVFTGTKSLQYTPTIPGGDPNEIGTIIFSFLASPKPSLHTDYAFAYGTTGVPTSNNIAFNYRGNTTVDMSSISPSDGSLSISQTTQGTGGGPVTLSVTGTQAGFYTGTTYTNNGDVQDSSGNLDTIIMDSTSIDLDTTPYSQSFEIMSISNSLGLEGSGNGISFNFPNGNYSYDHATRTITVLKAGLNPGTVNVPYTVTYAGGTKTGTGTLSIELTGTGPGISAGFVGGKYSSTGSSTSTSGNSYSSTKTGVATSSSGRTELQNSLMSHFGNMIRSRVDPNYTDVLITGGNSNNFLYDEDGTGYSSDYDKTMYLILKQNTPEEITDTIQIAKITSIVKNHFRQMRNHLLKFYNYTPSATSGCESSSTEGTESCVVTCNTELNLTFAPL